MYVCSIEKVSLGKGKGFFHATDLQMFLIDKDTVFIFLYILFADILFNICKM